MIPAQNPRVIRSRAPVPIASKSYEVWGITFGDTGFAATRKRFADQMRANPLFSKVIEQSPRDFDPAFLQTHSTLFRKGVRGQGYWVWKPQFMLKTLEAMKEGDLLLQGDAGSSIQSAPMGLHFDISPVKRTASGILAIPLQAKIARWTKMDLYSAMGVTLESQGPKQIVEAGRVIIQKRPESVAFLREWLDTCLRDSQHLVDDSPSVEPNLPEFQEHRHDQSIFSILQHKYDCPLDQKFLTFQATRIRTVPKGPMNWGRK